MGLPGLVDLVPNHRLQFAQTLGHDLCSRMSVARPGPKARQHRYQDICLEERELGGR
jgi:hypothetical protein